MWQGFNNITSGRNECCGDDVAASRKCRCCRSSCVVCACRRRILSRGRKYCRRKGPRPSSTCALRCWSCRRRRSSQAMILWRPDRGARCTGVRRRRSRRRRNRRRELCYCCGCGRPSVRLGVGPTSACCQIIAGDGRRLVWRRRRNSCRCSRRRNRSRRRRRCRRAVARPIPVSYGFYSSDRRPTCCRARRPWTCPPAAGTIRRTISSAPVCRFRRFRAPVARLPQTSSSGTPFLIVRPLSTTRCWLAVRVPANSLVSVLAPLRPSICYCGGRPPIAAGVGPMTGTRPTAPAIRSSRDVCRQ